MEYLGIWCGSSHRFQSPVGILVLCSNFPLSDNANRFMCSDSDTTGSAMFPGIRLGPGSRPVQGGPRDDWEAVTSSCNLETCVALRDGRRIGPGVRRSHPAAWDTIQKYRRTDRLWGLSERKEGWRQPHCTAAVRSPFQNDVAGWESAAGLRLVQEQCNRPILCSYSSFTVCGGRHITTSNIIGVMIYLCMLCGRSVV